jgi:hypothetical protein
MSGFKPTKESQDRWLKETGLDPWGYGSPTVLARLAQSLEFIRGVLPANFRGVISEPGAFNGAFTKMLVSAFPESSIYASDISDVAWPSAMPPTVEFERSDIRDGNIKRDTEALLLLECLYYMSPQEQHEAIVRMCRTGASPEYVFISGPLDGGKRYFSERSLCSLMRHAGYGMAACTVLNKKPSFADRFSWKRDPVIRWLEASLGWRRMVYANRPAWSIRHLNQFQDNLYRFVDITLLDWRIGKLNRARINVENRLAYSPRLRSQYAWQTMFLFRPV